MSLRTPIGLLSFPHVFVAHQAAPGADLRYSCSLLFDQRAQNTPEYQALRHSVAQAIDDKWGTGKSRDKAFTSKLRSPFRNTEEKDYTGYRSMTGGVYIQPWSKTRPGLIDAQKQDITVPEDVWPGQLARATVRAFAYQMSGNMGVNFNLNNLQICKSDGMVRLDGRKSAIEDFDEYVDAGMASGRRPGATVAVDEDEPPFMLSWRAQRVQQR